LFIIEDVCGDTQGVCILGIPVIGFEMRIADDKFMPFPKSISEIFYLLFTIYVFKGVKGR
jgi:hypothetical protein